MIAQGRWRSLLTAFILLPATAAATLPGDYRLPALGGGYSSYANQQEIRLGRAWARRFRHYVTEWQDPIIQRYIEQLVCRLLPHAQVEGIRPLVLLVDDDQLNAFAVPGGVIGVNGGLLLQAPDQDMLASVLAHELGHLAQHHYARQQNQADREMLPTLAGLLAGVVMAARGNGNAGIATMAGSQAMLINRQLAYSRRYEQEADRVGLTALAKAGMDPNAMPRMFDMLLRQSSLQGDTPPEFLMTHPLTASRVSDTRLRSAQYPLIATPHSLEYDMIRARAMLHFFPDDPALLRTRLQQDRVLPDALRYLDALLVARQHRAKEALQQLDTLAHQHDALLMIQASAAEIALQADLPSEALHRARLILRRTPDYTPAQLIAIRAGLQTAPSETYLRTTQLTQQQPENAEAWQLLAQAAHINGHDDISQKAMIEYRQLTGNLRGALALYDRLERTAKDQHDEAAWDSLSALKARLDDYVRDDMDAF